MPTCDPSGWCWCGWWSASTDNDLYIATRDAADGEFGTPELIDEIDLGREYRAFLSADLETIYFDRRPAGASCPRGGPRR